MVSFFLYFAVLELEFRAYTLSHSTSPIFVMSVFKIVNYLPWLALNHDHPATL
jgi:hypothetical protein